MEGFERILTQATAAETQDLLAGIGLVVDGNGNTLYRYAAGRQSLDSDSPPIDPDSTVAMASAGKFMTHIAALQLVERGLVTLDEPLSKHLPELDSLPVISREGDTGAVSLRPAAKKITLRNLLLHTSGVSSQDLVQERLASSPELAEIAVEEDAHPIVKHFSMPLIFEPGEGYSYGGSIGWTQLLVQRITGSFVTHMQTNMFDPLGMTLSTYQPNNKPEVWEKRMRMVERVGDGLIAADDASQGQMCSISDVGVVLSDLLSPQPKLLAQQEHIDLLFTGQLEEGSTAINDLRDLNENHGFCTGTSAKLRAPLVNWSAAGLVLEEDMPLGRMPKGTVTWDSMPNLLWAMNREKGLGMLFANQLIPVGDEKANGLALAFMNAAWGAFGKD
ncbi:beta-lactamase family protein [Thozetella sp. PMI_491]|nr:beta-lactamase family protein [Thozetella sp. PMI_491]